MLFKPLHLAGAALIGAVLALLFYAFSPRPVPVEVGKVTRGPLHVSVEDEGKTRIRERYVVSAPIAGTMARIELEPGAPVEPGTVLARFLAPPSPFLDPQARTAAEARLHAAEAAERQARASAARAQEGLALADKELARTRQLAQENAIPRQKLDQAQSLLKVRQSELDMAEFAQDVAVHEAESARAALAGPGAGMSGGQGTLDVTSPVHGVVLRVLRESSGAVGVGTPLLELGNPLEAEVVVDLLTQDAMQVQPGMPVALSDWGSGAPLAGHVRRVDPAAFTETSPLGVAEQRVNVIVDFDAPATARPALGDGFTVQARIVTWAEPSALQVPASAIFRTGQGWSAFVVERGHARQRAVEVGHRNPLAVQVMAGLMEGDAVVLHPAESVRDGAAVEAR
ncbi:MAG: efflux RND transporter periplasmic adaptor subunit [Deltaproteobacteria bacterium]|nr:efflux RND transporter periplasmic adaptor subunit [Deltaproteobacteria bacterium]